MDCRKLRTGSLEGNSERTDREMGAPWRKTLGRKQRRKIFEEEKKGTGLIEDVFLSLKANKHIFTKYYFITN